MREIGFWDYTCPQHGSLEHYTTADWDYLLDDMAAGGFNSLVLGIKWITTGYRSRLPWLDQEPGNAAIAADNATLYHALQGARQRGIKTWLLIVASHYRIAEFGLNPEGGTGYVWVGTSPYDVDQPGVRERILALCDEIAELFGSHADGLVIELEFCDRAAPHRIPLYNQWAAQNNRPPFEEIKSVVLEPRSYPFHHWRDFTTARRIETLQLIEKTIRDRGYRGSLSCIAEIANEPGAVAAGVSLAMLHDSLPHWALVTYDSIYDRRLNRLAAMDFCVEQPRQAGFEVLYLTRGVMTWPSATGLPPTDLEEQWRMALEDAHRFQPDALWFMGADARTAEGEVCNLAQLPQWGFEDGISARRRLMQMAEEAGLARP